MCILGIFFPHRPMKTSLSLSIMTVLLLGVLPTDLHAKEKRGLDRCVHYNAKQRSSCLRNHYTRRLSHAQIKYKKECAHFQSIEKSRCMRYGAENARDNRRSYRWAYLQHAKDPSAVTQARVTREQPINYRILVRRCMEQYGKRPIQRRK